MELTSPEDMDIRLKQLSYSSLLTLHSCPRKYQLYKLQSKQMEGLADNQSDLTFSFGHAVGEGIQEILQGKSEEEVIWNLYLQWDVELFEVNEKQNKSFWLALYAIQKFAAMHKAGFLNEYELAYFKDKDGNTRPAVELGFRIVFPNGFVFRGFVDAVLRHKISGAIKVLEIKTTSDNNLADAKFKNSAQAIGYSVVLDNIFTGLSDYSVIYLPYKTKEREFEVMEHQKTILMRAQWIQELLLDIDTIILYENTGIYPMRGESCFSWNRECEYFNLCTLSTDRLTKPIDAEMIEKIESEGERFDFNLTLLDLLNQQLENV